MNGNLTVELFFHYGHRHRHDYRTRIWFGGEGFSIWFNPPGPVVTVVTTIPTAITVTTTALRGQVTKGVTTTEQLDTHYKLRYSMRDLKSPSFIMSHDVVNSPSHYAEGREFETIDVIEDWGLGYHLGNAVKYISRAGRKDDILQDLRKAQWYLTREIENLELERAEAEGILYEYEVQEEFPC